MSKDTLRAQLLKARDSLENETRHQFSQSIADHLLHALPKHPIQIGSYMALGSEVDLKPLHRELLSSEHRLYIPRILSKTAMEMAALDNQEQLTEGAYGIQTSSHTETIAFSALEWLIMPCSGFDQRGYRLGMGGGFYDRALEHCKPNAPIRIGVAFSSQQASFEPDPWDQPFDWIVTEAGFIRR
jgi:5-formyltetrahydrofolate cyclo-ligase